VLKALALGANAVLIGRPYVFGLAVGGAEGGHEGKTRAPGLKLVASSPRT
jgi:hypothetical protein